MNVKRRMIIRAERHDQPYFMLARSVAQNTDLSYEALGLLTYLLSKPGDWVVQPETLMRAKSGRDKVYRLLRELIAAGHIEKQAHRGDHQRITGVEYIVYEIPRTVSPLPEKPDTVNPDTEKPDTAKPHITDKREEQTTEPQKAVAAVNEPDPLPERPTVFAEYERQFGLMLTAGIADTLKDMAAEYGEDWTRDALGITATSGKRGNLRYVEGILRRWKTEGREPERTATTVVVDEKTAWRAAQKGRPNVRYDAAIDMLLPAFKDEDDRRRYITEYLNMPYVPFAEEVAS